MLWHYVEICNYLSIFIHFIVTIALSFYSIQAISKTLFCFLLFSQSFIQNLIRCVHDMTRWKVKPENTNLVVFPVEHLVFRSLVNCKRWEGWLESRTKDMISTLGSVFCIWHYCFIKQPTFHIPWIMYLQIWSLLFCHFVPHIQDVQEKNIPYDKGKPLKRSFSRTTCIL